MASKMYILIKDQVNGQPQDAGHVVLAAAHASLSGYLTFVNYERNTGDNKVDIGGVPGTPTEYWGTASFRKVICRVTDEQFEKAKTLGTNRQDMRIMTESAFDDAEVAIVFRPVDLDDPNRDKRLCGFLQGLKLYK